MRPGAVKIACEVNNKEVKVTAVQNPDQSIALVIFNPTEQSHTIEINISKDKSTISIPARALQTVVINN